MNRNFVTLTVISIILISGCASKPVDPVSFGDVDVEIAPIVIKEFQKQNIQVEITNNATEPIDSVKVISLSPFTLSSSPQVNIQGKKDAPVKTTLTIQIEAPGFKTDTENSAIGISYESGMDTKGKPVISTMTIPVQATILPDAKLEAVGFVKDVLDPRLQNWELRKGENVTILFHVRNEGQTTIDEDILTVRYEVENSRIGGNGSIIIPEAMARGGTSYTRSLEVPVLKDAPNGETDIYVTLLKDDNVLDSKTLQLKVIL